MANEFIARNGIIANADSRISGTLNVSGDINMGGVKIATESYVTTAIANLTDSAPDLLNTLNELAAALGDDPNFATTVTNNIATKVPLAGGTMSGNLQVNAKIGTIDDTGGLHLRGVNDVTHKIYYNTSLGNVWEYNAPIIFQYYNLNSPITRFTLDNSGNLSVSGTLSAAGYNKSNWDTAFGWGNNYISDVRVEGTNLVFTGEGGAYNESVDLSTLPFQAQGSYLTAESDTLATVTNRGNSTTGRINVRGAGNQGGGNIMMGNTGNGTNKWSYLTGTHYNADTQTQGFSIIGGLSTDTYNAVVIGGNIYESNPATQIQFWTHTDTTHTLGGTIRGIIDSSGNWGIGTSSPSEKLTVAGGNVLLFPSDNTRQLSFYNSSYGLTANNGLEFFTGDLFRFRQGSTELARLTTAGLGIGTTNPSYKLDLLGTTDAVVARLSQGYERVRYNSVDLLGYNDGHLWLIGNNNPSLVISSSWDWDQQIEIKYVPNSSGAASGVLSIGQLTGQKNSATYTHGRTDFYVNGAVRSNINTYGVGIRREAASNERLAIDIPDGVWGVHLYRDATPIGGLHVNNDVITLQSDTNRNVEIATGTGNANWNGNTIATRTWVQAQGYLTSETDSQELEWNQPEKLLTISNGNTVDLSQMASVSDIEDAGFITAETDTLATVTARGATTTSNITVNGNLRVNTNGFIEVIAGSNQVNGMTVYNAALDGYLSYRITTNAHARGWGWEFTTNEANSAVANVYHRFGYGGADTYLNSGNVGIGTTSPSEKLHVVGAAIFDGGAGNSSTDSVLYVTKSNNNDWGLYVNASGVDYGMYTRVSPTAEYAFAIHNGSTWTTRITGSGVVYLGEKNAIEGASDSWLRLNNQGHYTSGVYTPARLRNDGAFENYGGIYGYATIRGRKAQTDGTYTTAALWTESYDNTTTGIAFHISGNVGKFLEMRTNGSLYWDGAPLPTQAWVTSQGYTTTTYVDEQVAALVDSAPDALNTLKELSNALGDDQNFATNVTNSIAGKVSKDGDVITTSNNYGLVINHTPVLGDFVDALTLRSTTSGQRAQIGFATVDADGDHHRASIRAYKGAGTLEGVFGIALRQTNTGAHVQRFTLTSEGNLTIDGQMNVSGGNSSQWNTAYGWGNHAGLYIPINPDGDGPAWTYSDANPTINGTSIGGRQSFGADGDAVTGGALQARLLNAYDGHVNSAYGYYIGNLNYGGDSEVHETTQVINSAGTFVGPNISTSQATIGRVLIDYDGTDTWFRMQSGNRMRITTTGGTDFIIPNTGEMSYNGYTVWHAGNDGGGSGLDADTVDGIQASTFATRQDGARYSTDVNSLMSSGFYNVESAPANSPVSYGQIIVAKGIDTAFQIAGGYSNDAMFFRGQGYGPEAGGFYPWRRVWHNGDFSSTNISNWNTAYGWGNHANYGYWNTDLTEPKDIQSTTVRFVGDVEVQGTFTESSSIRFKENIKPLEPTLGKVEQLNPVTYNKIGVQEEEIGLIAEEVAQLFPEVVTYNEEGQASGIQYQRLSVILLKAVQELTDRVNKLENK